MRPTRTITFTCSWCYKDVTEERAPGHVPTYCRACKPDVMRAATRQRVKQYRERHRDPTLPKRGPGRPRRG